MGMPYDLYWDGEYGTKTAYRKAYQKRIENDQRLADINNWQMGKYIIKALQAVPLFVGGLNTKGVNLPDYPEKPLMEIADEEKKKEKRQKFEEDQSKLAQALFQQFVSKVNVNITKRLDREKQEQQGAGQ